MATPSLKRRTAAMLLASSALSVVGFAWAGAAVAADAPKSGADATQVEEIVVTAQKRVERLQDVPASVAVVNLNALADQGITSFQDYAARVPGMSLTSAREGNAQITLRGITTGPAQSASATAFYVDEAPIGSVNAYVGGSSITPDLDPSDVANLEVLKGPQGTLYGAGSVGGLIKFDMVKPDFVNYGGSIQAGVNDVDHGGTGYNVRASVNLPVINDRMVLHISAFDRVDAGFIDNVVPATLRNTGGSDINKDQVSGGRIALGTRISDHLELDLSALFQDTHDDGSNVEDVSKTTLAPIYGDLKGKRFADEPSDVWLRVFNATAKGDIGGFKLVSSTTYQTFTTNSEGDGTLSYGPLLGGLGIRTDAATSTKRFSEEVRADNSAFGGKLDYQLGLYFTHEDDSNRVLRFEVFNPATGATLAFPNIINAAILSRYTEFSEFANATWHVTDKFDILGGVRFSEDRQHYFQDYFGLLVGAHPLIQEKGEKGNIATYLFSPSYKFTPDSMLYARVSTGYRPGGPNATPPPAVFVAPNTFAPDKLTSYEVGYKGEFFDHKLTLDAASFYTNWENIQIQTSAGGFNFFVNGGTAVSKGAELTLRLQPVTGLTFGLNGAYTDARLTAPAPAAGGVSGDRLPLVPKYSGSLTADYRWSIASDWQGLLNGSANYTGNRISDYSGKTPQAVPAYTTVDLRAGLEHANWTLSVYGKNLGDSRGILTLHSETLTASANPFGASVITPRTIGVELSAKF
jgi:iron complex outermembrane receptor protein